VSPGSCTLFHWRFTRRLHVSYAFLGRLAVTGRFAAWLKERALRVRSVRPASMIKTGFGEQMLGSLVLPCRVLHFEIPSIR
jgi:hypothetical protein